MEIFISSELDRRRRSSSNFGKFQCECGCRRAGWMVPVVLTLIAAAAAPVVSEKSHEHTSPTSVDGMRLPYYHWRKERSCVGAPILGSTRPQRRRTLQNTGQRHRHQSRPPLFLMEGHRLGKAESSSTSSARLWNTRTSKSNR